MKKKSDKIALIAPNEHLESLISFLCSSGDYDVDHFPNLDEVEDYHAFPFGNYQLVIIDSRVTYLPIDAGVLDSLKAVFGECAFVVLDRENAIEDLGSNSIVKLVGNPGIHEILKSGLRARNFNEAEKLAHTI